MLKKYLDLDFSQDRVNTVWQDIWEGVKINPSEIFANQLFIENWKVYSKYITNDGLAVLEAGGGSGRFGFKIARDFSKSQVTIVDIVDSSVAFMKNLAEIMKIKNVYIFREDIMNLSFADDKFDLVISDAVIQHMENDQVAVAEMARVLKPGGTLIISVVNFWNFHSLYKLWLKLSRQKYEYQSERSYTKKELKKLFKINNLKIIAQDGFYPAYGILRLKKYHRIFKLLGRACNRSIKILDLFTGRFFSKYFGFELVIVGKK